MQIYFLTRVLLHKTLHKTHFGADSVLSSEASIFFRVLTNKYARMREILFLVDNLGSLLGDLLFSVN